MNDMEQLHISLSSNQMALLTQFAQSQSLTADILAEQAIDAYLTQRLRWNEGILHGISQLENGQRVSLEEAFALF